jgi:hypothetical protein
MVTAQPGSTTVSLARFEVGKPDQRKEVSLRVSEVIRAANELGATYPDILQLLADASKQKNLSVAVATDKLPEAGRTYYRPTTEGVPGGRAIKIGRDRFAPGSFPEVDDPEEAARRKEESDRAAQEDSPGGTMANVPGVPPESDTETEPDSKPDKNKKSLNRKPSEKAKRSRSWFGGNK